jgi:hypothetical protein
MGDGRTQGFFDDQRRFFLLVEAQDRQRLADEPFPDLVGDQPGFLGRDPDVPGHRVGDDRGRVHVTSLP